MLEVMEPETWCENPTSQTLKYPNRWKDEIKGFWKAVQSSKLQELREVQLPADINQ